MARRWLGVLAVVATLAVAAAAVAVFGRGDKTPPATPNPRSAQPSQQTGDDADLMRRLQRTKLVKKAR